MKKLLIIMTCFIAVACSKTEDNQSEIENSTLLKTMTSGNQTMNFSYNGFKLSEVTTVGSSSKEVFTYVGDLITEIKDFNTTTNKAVNIKSYTYENNKLKTFIEDEVSSDVKTKYIYTNKADGTVAYVKNSINKTTQEETLICSGNLTFADGVLVKDDMLESKYPACTSTFSKGEVFEYDNKNSFYKNIVGLDKLYDSKECRGKSNLLKSYQYTRIGTKVGEEHVLETKNEKPEVRTYIYNSSNFPTESKSYDLDGKLKETTQYSY